MENTEDTSSPTSGIDDLVSEALGSEPSAEASAAAPPEPASEPAQGTEVAQEPAPAAAVAETPNAQAAPEPTPQTIQIGDRTYTAQELNAALTTAQQFGHLQSKYVELKERMDRIPQATGQPQPPPPQISPAVQLAQIRASYDPMVQKAVADGLIEKDFATLFPNMAAQMLMYRDGFAKLAQQQAQGQAEAAQAQAQSQSQGLLTDIGRSIATLGQSGGVFAPLQDPGKVREFFQYLWDLNPQVGHLRNPQFLARQWAAYNYNANLQAQQQQMAAAARSEAVRYARADATTATRAPSVPSQPKTPLDQMTDDFFAQNL